MKMMGMTMYGNHIIGEALIYIYRGIHMISMQAHYVCIADIQYPIHKTLICLHNTETDLVLD